MKALKLTLGVGALALATWWALTESSDRYRALDETDIAYAGVVVNTPDPERLARFYLDTFGGERLSATEENAEIRLRTPGYEGRGPTLTLRRVAAGSGQGPLRAQDHGYAHICFEADDVPGLTRRIRANGGTLLSRFDTPHIEPGIYALDPDGNVIEGHLPFATPLTPRTILRTLNSLLRTVLDLAPPSDDRVRFLHVNINSANWERTARFYEAAFDARPTGFQRDYQGSYISQLTGVEGAAVRGRHVALPGYSEGGPTFEIFSYNQSPTQGPLGIDDLGRVMTEFTVRDLDAIEARVVEAGGTSIERQRPNSSLVADADGNLILLRRAERVTPALQPGDTP